MASSGPSRTLLLRCSLLFSFFLFVILQGVVPSAAAQSHGHRSLNHRNTAGASNIDDAQALVNEALKGIAAANKLRVENPRRDKSGYRQGAFESSATVQRSDSSFEARSNASSIDYVIPESVITAAKSVAESRSHTKGATIDGVAKAAKLKAQYWPKRSDADTASYSARDSSSLETRASAFWMENMSMNGRSPLAPSGYVVFRNVKDYGAVGDGVHDDTAAINSAISSGSRCGQACGSSTILPAVVYFPSGTYLVSGSITQYYNTQLIGNPLNRPTILAASSFVGLGVISSDVHPTDGSVWYTPQNNFYRSVRNLVIDITNTDPNAYVCGIHWEIAQATDLQNIDFYMKSGTTQQGIYMEDGSGGFMTDLYFSGGNFGAYFGNQQFTTRNLLFNGCKTAIQIFWDWGWTLQGIAVVSGTTGITVTGGADTSHGGAGVGAMLITDSTFSALAVGISTSLLTGAPTNVVVQNTVFTGCTIAIQDVQVPQTLVAGGTSSVKLASWGMGNLVQGTSSTASFQSGKTIAAPSRAASLVDSSTNNFFTRSAPTYEDIAASSMVNIKSQGAKGDGVTDDSAIINQVLAAAAKSNSIVFFPFGIYLVKDTVKVPVGSRIVGQAWSQIMASGTNFQDMSQPRAVVKVGTAGDNGVIEISDMMVTVSGSTAGAVLIEWNVHQSTQGSAAMWNTNMRVGGARGSQLQAADCPKLSGAVKSACVAASLQLHLTSSSSAYLENIWAWTADHDLDITSQAQIDVYSGRGILIESKGPTWLWGTASEHNVLYQYALSNAKTTFLGLIQTESPYFQPAPKAPLPFTLGNFANDPSFSDCSSTSTTCAVSWALHIVNSATTYIYSAGLYSWFNGYSQDCLNTENCQTRLINIESSSDLWIYNLMTKGALEMISPLGETPTYASNNVNGFMSTVMAWLEGSSRVVGSPPPTTCQTVSGMASPTPANSVCGLKGSSYTLSGAGTLAGYTAGSPYVASLAACSTKCLATSCCTNVFFIQGSNCNLHYGPRALLSGVGSFSYYDATCFTCGELSCTSTSTTATPTSTTHTTTSTPSCKTVSGLASPTPSSATCGLKGTSHAALGAGSIIGYGSSSPYVTSLASCSAQCLATSCCTNVYFIQGSACNLHYGPNAFDQGVGSTQFEFYNASCFTCGALPSCTSTSTSTTPTCKTVSGIISPTPSAAICGGKGSSLAASNAGTIVGYVAGSPYVASLAACSSQCLATSCCTNIYFIQGKNCNLHYGPKAFNSNVGNPLFNYYDATCFTCRSLSCSK
ncbi:hypothetical protein V502_03566 [Pseudogymnoascus sp. VKM F-4520 (FW-2644)]|nr:hypothetical protein V502_03566 [Pseudogymnoascus sp. VKM F-4520 (FW-2644)]